MNLIKILLFVTKSTFWVKIFSIGSLGIYFIYDIMYYYDYFNVKINEIKEIPIIFLFIILFLFLVIPQLLRNLLLDNKLLIELIAKIIGNLISTSLTMKAGLVTMNFLSLTPDVNGKLIKFILFNNDITIYRNFSLDEKKIWLQEILQKINLNEKDIDLNNIPWDTFANKNDLLTFILMKLTEKKTEILQSIDFAKPLSKLLSLIEFIGNHPYLTLAAISFSSLIVYFYYNAIINYLLKLGAMLKDLIKASKDHAEVSDLLLKNEVIIMEQIQFILKELPKVASFEERAILLNQVVNRLGQVGTGLSFLSEIRLVDSERIRVLETSMKTIIELLIRHGVYPLGSSIAENAENLV
jgi:hypothetical protein